MSQGTNPKPLAYTHKPNKQEAADCPYLFEELEAIFYKKDPNDITYYTKWHRQDIWSRNIKGPWSYETSNQEIMTDNWNLYYPGFKHLKFRDPDPAYLGQVVLNKEGQRHLAGKFNGKSVLWSPAKNIFVYTNNITVTFPPDRVPLSRPPTRAPSRAQSPEDSQDEEVVTTS